MNTPIVPCMCPRCHADVLALPNGASMWEKRAEVALRHRARLRRQLEVGMDDECDLAERRRARRMGGAA